VLSGSQNRIVLGNDFIITFFFAAKTIKDSVRVALTSINTFWVKFEAKQHVLFKMKKISYLPTWIPQTTCELPNIDDTFLAPN